MEKRVSLIKAVLEIYRVSQSFIGEHTRQYRIGRGQWYFLNRLLLGGDGLSQEQLSREMVVDSAHTVRALRRLEEEGYITRRPDPRDARRKNIYVTPQALDIREEYHQIYKDLNGILTRGFTPEEAAQARELLYRMRDNLADYRRSASEAAVPVPPEEPEDKEEA